MKHRAPNVDWGFVVGANAANLRNSEATAKSTEDASSQVPLVRCESERVRRATYLVYP